MVYFLNSSIIVDKMKDFFYNGLKEADKKIINEDNDIEVED